MASALLEYPVRPDRSERAAILIVNGGTNPVQGRWLTLCLDRIRAHTPPADYHLYIWNNNIQDTLAGDEAKPGWNCTWVQAPADLVLTHPHADPLQRLYERARADGFHTIVTLDTDAHPIRDGWLALLTEAIDNGAVLAGVWRDELKSAIAPYVHASGLCTTVDYLESHGLRLDRIAPNRNGVIHDTLSCLTETAEAEGLPIFKLRRSNRRQFHRLIGGIYGDCLYHHGAGSRPAVTFWDEASSAGQARRNGATAGIAMQLVFTDYHRYMSWLSGRWVDPDFAARMQMLTAGRFEAFDTVCATVSHTQDRNGMAVEPVPAAHNGYARRIGALWRAMRGSRSVR